MNKVLNELMNLSPAGITASAVNTAGWELTNLLTERGELNGHQFNNLKPIMLKVFSGMVKEISEIQELQEVTPHHTTPGWTLQINGESIRVYDIKVANHIKELEQQLKAKQTLIEQQAVAMEHHIDHGDTDHERHMCKMLLRMMRGQPVECRVEPKNLPHVEWHDATELSLNTDWKYREPVKKLNIPWEHIKHEYIYAAMDSGDDIIVFEDKPSVEGGSFTNTGKWAYVTGLNIDTDGIEWKESLTIRPAPVTNAP